MQAGAGARPAHRQRRMITEVPDRYSADLDNCPSRRLGPKLAANLKTARVIGWFRENSCLPWLSQDLHRERDRIGCDGLVHVGQGKALAYVMAVRSRCDKADPTIASHDRLITGHVGLGAVHRQQHQSLRGPAATLCQGRGAPDKLTLVERDEAIQTRHRRGVRLCKFQRPNAVALFQPQAVLGSHPDGLKAEILASLDERAPQCSLLGGANGDFVAQFPGQRNADDGGPGKADIENARAHKWQSVVVRYPRA